MIKNVFIDIDGTITDNFHIHTKGWDYILKLMGKELNSSFYQNLHGSNTQIAIQKIANKVNYSLTDDELKKFVKIKNEIRNAEINKLNSSNLFKGVDSFFEELRINDIKIICFSISTACIAILDKLNVLSYFNDFICGDKMIELKSSSSKCFEDFILDNKLNQKECLVIDDDIQVLLNVKKNTNIFCLGIGSNPNYKKNGILSIYDYETLTIVKLKELLKIDC